MPDLKKPKPVQIPTPAPRPVRRAQTTEELLAELERRRRLRDRSVNNQRNNNGD